MVKLKCSGLVTIIRLETDHLTCREGCLCFFVSFRIFFSDNTRVKIFCRAKRQNSTLGYMTKTLNQIFFSSTKIRIYFSATLGIGIFFFEKNHNPIQVKWSFPYVKVGGGFKAHNF